VIVYPLGRESLAERLRRRMTTSKALDLAAQLLAGLAHAHQHRIVHCDVKPENLILFAEDRLRLADFGIAKVAYRTLRAAGTGTVGFVSPEQAMGRPSFRSDVFSAGLVIYRLLAGRLPEWPFEWPPPGYQRLRSRVHPDLIALLKRSLEVDVQRRFENASRMLEVYRRARTKTVNAATRRNARRRGTSDAGRRDLRQVWLGRFQRRYGRLLATRHRCARCGGPVAETMGFCPWCRSQRRLHQGEVSFPAACPRCGRGVKLDWRFCPWCYGGAIGPSVERSYSDVRYQGRCANRGCPRGELMPFMRYCPWCRTKVRRRWKIEGHARTCGRCGWGVIDEFWSACPWCGADLRRKRGR
jgi:serine/threonine-protein kinase